MPRLIAVTSDLFLQSRLLELARSLNVQAGVLPGENPKISESDTDSLLVVLDLDSPDYDAFQMAKELKEQPNPPVLFGFYPHVRSELRERAQNVGFDYIVTNRELMSELNKVLKAWKSSGS